MMVAQNTPLCFKYVYFMQTEMVACSLEHMTYTEGSQKKKFHKLKFSKTPLAFGVCESVIC